MKKKLNLPKKAELQHELPSATSKYPQLLELHNEFTGNVELGILLQTKRAPPGIEPGTLPWKGSMLTVTP